MVANYSEIYHKKYFDLTAVAGKLRTNGYTVLLQDFCDEVLRISEYNQGKTNLQATTTGLVAAKEEKVPFNRGIAK